MARSRAFARYLFRLRHQKRYSFTKTKMLIGFVVSLFTSIYFGTYFETHGLSILREAYRAVTGGPPAASAPHDAVTLGAGNRRAPRSSPPPSYAP